MSEEYRALTVTEKVIKILKNCFESECKGDSSARSRAESEIKLFLVKTGDGSFTLRSDGSNGQSEIMHTQHGAVEEAIQKFVEPSKLLEKEDVNVLDICSGLGYN
jgi:predicted methyltransferase